EEEKRFLSQTAVAKEYLEAHELLPFVRALLQTVIRDRPLDPYSFIAEQFRIAAAAFKPAQPAPGFAAAADAFVDPELEKETGPDPPKLPKSDEPVGPSSELPTAVPGTTCRPQREEEEPQ
ncbi:DNAJB11, partial [Symbiodinium microadriaticum]